MAAAQRLGEGVWNAPWAPTSSPCKHSASTLNQLFKVSFLGLWVGKLHAVHAQHHSRTFNHSCSTSHRTAIASLYRYVQSPAPSYGREALSVSQSVLAPPCTMRPLLGSPSYLQSSHLFSSSLLHATGPNFITIHDRSTVPRYYERHSYETTSLHRYTAVTESAGRFEYVLPLVIDQGSRNIFLCLS